MSPAAPARPLAGQAALEYVALLALLAVVTAVGAAALAPPDLAGSVVRTLRLALCRVAGGVCTAADARADDLEPCVLRALGDEEATSVTVGFVRVGREDALEVEKRSDGTATVAFVDGWRGGAEAGVGVTLTPLGLDGGARFGGGAVFHGGRAWEFRSTTAADAFVRRFGAAERTRGEVEGLCPVCGDRPDPRMPDATFREGGAFAEAGFDGAVRIGGRGASVHGEAGALAVLGHRTRGETRTWYVRVDASVLARLGLVLGAAGAEGSGSGVIEYETEAGEPTKATIRTTAGVAADATQPATHLDLGTVAKRLRDATAAGAAGARGGVQLETSVSLDLRDGANLAALRGVLRLQDPVAEGRALRVLADRLDADGDVGVSVFRTATRHDAAGAEVKLGPGLGASHEETRTTRDLLRAWALPPGGVLREREDCVAA